MLLEQLGRIDLNLLIILQVLLEERNGSRAARRLHLGRARSSGRGGARRLSRVGPICARQAVPG